MNLPRPPADKFDAVAVTVRMPPFSDLASNVVQIPSSEIAPNSTVAISFGEAVAGGPALVAARDGMQKALLRSGFRVLDPARVSAHLRELATAGNCGAEVWWRCVGQLAPGELRQLDTLRSGLERGEIPQDQYAAEIDRFRRVWDARVVSGAALRQAIKAGKLSADYVLVVEGFAAGELVSRTLDLGQVAKVRRFMRDYPDLRADLAKRKLMTCQGVGSEIKARLVDTRTAEVVWMGNHQVSDLTQPGNEYRVELAVRKFVANRDEVEGYLAANKGKLHRQKVVDGIPPWRFRTELIGPRLLEGRCGLEDQTPQGLQRAGGELAAQVAGEIVGTIRLVGQSAGAAPPSSTSAPSKNEVFFKDTSGNIRVR